MEKTIKGGHTWLNQILKNLWRTYVRDRDNSSWLKYTKQRNKVKQVIKNDLQEKQNRIAEQYKLNPKTFWKYVNSKSKHTEKIGDLKVTDEQGNTVICSSAKTKADSLCKFFGSVFCIETDDNYDPLPEATVFKESTSY